MQEERIGERDTEKSECSDHDTEQKEAVKFKHTAKPYAEYDRAYYSENRCKQGSLSGNACIKLAESVKLICVLRQIFLTYLLYLTVEGTGIRLGEYVISVIVFHVEFSVINLHYHPVLPLA